MSCFEGQDKLVARDCQLLDVNQCLTSFYWGLLRPISSVDFLGQAQLVSKMPERLVFDVHQRCAGLVTIVSGSSAATAYQ